MKAPGDLLNIVVVGAMNPRVHTPGWYRHVGLLSQEEMDLAVNDPKTMTIPPLSQIQVGPLLIVCHQDRWIIEATSPDQIKRLQDITTTVFDDLLKHTPISAMGFNFHYNRATKSENVGRAIATSLLRVPVGLEIENPRTGTLQVKGSFGAATLQVDIQPFEVPGTPNVLAILNNYEYSYKDAGEFFYLKENITSFYDLDRRDAEGRVAAIVRAIDIIG